MNLEGKRVIVVGLGASGRAAARLAVAKGAKVLGADLRCDVEPIEGVELVLGPHPAGLFETADLLILSPGVPPTKLNLKGARDAGVAIMGELGFAASFVSAPMIAITGTNGKSTVTSFVAQLAREAGLTIFAGGNLGNPLSSAVLSGELYDVIVVEVSSYQLEYPAMFHPHAAVVLNLSPDHLARHGDMATYASTKCRIFSEMTSSDFAILPADDEGLLAAAHGSGGERLWMGKHPGVLLQGDRCSIQLPNGRSATLELGRFGLDGAHNRANAGVAALLLFAMGIAADALQRGIQHLVGLPHRMERVGVLNGAQWINDSKATNVAATEAALQGVRQPVVLLLGGQAKEGDDFGALAPYLGAQRGVVTFGASGEDIARQLEARGVTARRTERMASAVRCARELAQEDDLVLLSPGCASFDEFRNFEHRGEEFVTLLRELRGAGVIA
jgi:UDP-N-acetylmuramoylalanine--D-glutamate ligase